MHASNAEHSTAKRTEAFCGSWRSALKAPAAAYSPRRLQVGNRPEVASVKRSLLASDESRSARHDALLPLSVVVLGPLLAVLSSPLCIAWSPSSGGLGDRGQRITLGRARGVQQRVAQIWQRTDGADRAGKRASVGVHGWAHRSRAARSTTRSVVEASAPAVADSAGKRRCLISHERHGGGGRLPSGLASGFALLPACLLTPLSLIVAHPPSRLAARVGRRHTTLCVPTAHLLSDVATEPRSAPGVMIAISADGSQHRQCTASGRRATAT